MPLASNDEERACHRFAGAFLVPAEEVRKALAENLIGESRAAELLGIRASQLARDRNLEASHGVDHQ